VAHQYYKILGVAPGASSTDIKKAYHSLARKFHPDHNDGHPLAQHRFRLLAEAYKVVGDKTERSQYDRFGDTALARRTSSGVIGGLERFVTNLESFVDSRMKRVQKRGEDRRRVMPVSLKQACFGGTAVVEVECRSKCSRCQATGAEPGTPLENCHVCIGVGTFKQGPGLLSTTQACTFCQGVGRIAPKPCTQCEGLGEETAQAGVEIAVPRGVRTGRRLILRGRGQPGANGGADGDLFIDIKVEEHTLLERDGDDLRCRVPISFVEAVAGGTAAVPTLEGELVRIKIPAGSQSGQSLRLAGRGVPLSDTERGDMYVHLEVETPTVDPVAAQPILERLEQIGIHPRRAAFMKALADATESTDS
jgi:molecular chaperone DnaJ